MYAVVVPLKVKPEMREKFLAAALDDSTCSVRDEPGCLRFDVLQDNTDPNKFFFYEVFYEVYLDENAFKAHQASAHYPRWRAAAAEVLAEPTNASRCTTIFPQDYK
ncbi:MAG: antibiotic biosynthesis monooxygenase [Betaproteobacteria bacterium]|nr:antibiotic biosynthesis monooxygenase [Betaproteobacteria bacterium]